jgi:hypothetical protein
LDVLALRTTIDPITATFSLDRIYANIQRTTIDFYGQAPWRGFEAAFEPLPRPCCG